jgi:hypothetical protein
MQVISDPEIDGKVVSCTKKNNVNIIVKEINDISPDIESVHEYGVLTRFLAYGIDSPFTSASDIPIIGEFQKLDEPQKREKLEKLKSIYINNNRLNF